MASKVPDFAPRILKRTLDKLELQANSNGERFGGEITDALREAGVEPAAPHFGILPTRSLLVRTMEFLGEAHPGVHYKKRIPLYTALRFLTEAIDWTTRHLGLGPFESVATKQSAVVYPHDFT